MHVYPFLTVDWILGQFGKKLPEVQKEYRRFVQAGMKVSPAIWEELKAQCILGSNEFIEKLKLVLKEKSKIMEIPNEQRLAFRPLLKKLFPPQKVKTKEERNEAIQKAYFDYCYTLSEIARHLGLQTLYLNLDIEWDRIHFDSQAALLKKIELELCKKQGFVFIDEIQRKENAGLFLKGLYDLKLPYKFIFSGSGSLELKEKIHESLIGRKRLFELTTITFEEFINHKTDYRYKENLQEFFEIEKDKTRQLLIEYMNFGGYPRVILETEQGEKVQIIDEIYRSVLEKDIDYLLKVDKTEAFSALIRVLSSQIGNLINYSELSSTLNISYQTVKKYLLYSQQIFLLDLISPYARNARKEITRSPTAYFWDLGLRNYSLGLFGPLNSPSECGFVFENLVFLLLRTQMKLSSTKLKFWRTKDKAEVDFILERSNTVTPIEIKFKLLKKEEIPRSLRSFIERYGPSEAYIVNLDFYRTLKIGKTSLVFSLIMNCFSKNYRGNPTT